MPIISVRFKGSNETLGKKTPAEPEKSVAPAPNPSQMTTKNATFDQVTHTGQAWDEADYRLNRFTFSEKQVNPNIAAHLITEAAPIACEEQVVHCDGGHPALGHPKVYINLDKPGTHACGYCGLRFYNSRLTKPGDLVKAHIQV